MNSSLKARFERLGPVRDVARNPSGSAGAILLHRAEGRQELRVVDATLALARRGATMLRAKRAVEAALEGGTAVLSLTAVEDDAALSAELSGAGLRMRWVPSPRPVQLAALRSRLGMTRAQFALAYGLDVETVRNWEAGRRDPGPARAYLQAIENDPEAVLAAYSGGAP